MLLLTSTATHAAAAATRRHRVLATDGLVMGQAAYLQAVLTEPL